MSAKKRRIGGAWIAAVRVVAAGILLSLPAPARADYTFGDWAAGSGFGPGDAMPEIVDASHTDPAINNLAGIGDYDWNTTPSTGLYLRENQISTIGSGAFSGLTNLRELDLTNNPSLTNLNLERADLPRLRWFDMEGSTNVTSVSLNCAVLSQWALAALLHGGTFRPGIGIGELPGITELDLGGMDFAEIADLGPLGMMDDLTDLWLVEVQNMDALQLDLLLDDLATIQATDVEGVLYMTQADFDAFNTAGGGLLAAWDAEPGHHVRIIPEPATSALLAVACVCLLAWRRRPRGSASVFSRHEPLQNV